jgi:hypothetical protein
VTVTDSEAVQISSYLLGRGDLIHTFHVPNPKIGILVPLFNKTAGTDILEIKTVLDVFW